MIEHLNKFVLDDVVRLFLTYEMIQHISGIFQASEQLHPGPLCSIHPSKHRTISDRVPFHLGRV
jgi:hypothetical protein